MHARPRIRVTTQPRGQQRLNKPVLIWGAIALLVLGLLAWLWWQAQKPKVPKAKGPRERQVPEYVVTEKPTPIRQDLRLPKDYSKMPLEDAPAPAPAPTPPVPGQPTKPPPVAPGKWGPPRPPPAPGGLPPPPGAPPLLAQPPPAALPRGTVVPVKAPDDPRAGRWFGGKPAIQGNVLAAPLPVEAADTQPSKLFPKAVWEKPQDPTKVLYADQIINGLLMQDLNSDAPAGTIRIKVTQDVVDRWGLGHVLIPLDSTFLGTMEGSARYGQSRIPGAINMVILPNGTAVQLSKSQAGDAMGAAGIPADVNNHYGALILGAGIQMMLNIGTRAVAGSTTGFNPTLEQEFAQDVARGVNRLGQQVTQRELQRSPTLSQDYGYPVTIQFAREYFVSIPTDCGVQVERGLHAARTGHRRPDPRAHDRVQSLQDRLPSGVSGAALVGSDEAVPVYQSPAGERRLPPAGAPHQQSAWRAQRGGMAGAVEAQADPSARLSGQRQTASLSAGAEDRRGRGEPAGGLPGHAVEYQAGEQRRRALSV